VKFYHKRAKQLLLLQLATATNRSGNASISAANIQKTVNQVNVFVLGNSSGLKSKQNSQIHMRKYNFDECEFVLQFVFNPIHEGFFNNKIFYFHYKLVQIYRC